jgi:sugar lactone lactonase YvrE
VSTSIFSAKIARTSSLLFAIAMLSACGGGGGSAIPQHAVKKPPQIVVGVHGTVVRPYASSCAYPNSDKQRLYVVDVAIADIVRFNPPSHHQAFVNQLPYRGLDVAFDHLKNMWVSEFMGDNTIQEFAPPYNGPPIFQTTTPLTTPGGIAFDGADNLYITDGFDNLVVVLAPPYTGNPTTIAVPNPESLAFDAKCNLWVASQSGNAYEFTPPYTSPPRRTISVPGASAIALDSNKNLFVGTSGQSQDEVLEFAPPYNGAPIATITKGVNSVGGIDLDVHGNLFVSSYRMRTIKEYAAPYHGAPVLTLKNKMLGEPNGISFGPK